MTKGGTERASFSRQGHLDLKVTVSQPGRDRARRRQQQRRLPDNEILRGRHPLDDLSSHTLKLYTPNLDLSLNIPKP